MIKIYNSRACFMLEELELMGEYLDKQDWFGWHHVSTEEYPSEIPQEILDAEPIKVRYV